MFIICIQSCQNNCKYLLCKKKIEWDFAKTKEQIIDLHSTYHCGAGNFANHLKDPFSFFYEKVLLGEKTVAEGTQTARFLR